MVASFSISARFTAKIELVFVLIQENAFSLRSHFKANTVLGIFKIALRLRDRHVFLLQSVEILNDFITLASK